MWYDFLFTSSVGEGWKKKVAFIRVKDEKQLHSIFNEKRVRGEWFDLNGSDLKTIRQYFNCEEL